MKKLFVGLTALAASAGIAQAGSIDRFFLDTGVLFEKGNVIKAGFFWADPKLSGQIPAFAGGGTTGDGGDSFFNFNGAIKYQFNEKIGVALLFDQPYGADVAYPGGVYSGLSADWETKGVTLLGRYKFPNNFSVYGGPRLIQTDASIFVPASILALGGLPASYTANSDKQEDFGFVAGAAYEKPEIALRVSLTYQSQVKQTFNVTEAFSAFIPPPPGPTKASTKLPQVVTLDFQTGIAPKTLLFGMVRWSDWSKFDVITQQFQAVTGAKVADVLDDVWTFRLGVARQITDQVSLFVRGTYEPKNNSILSRVAPTDGRRAIGGGAIFTFGNVKLNTGAEYIRLGGGTDGLVQFQSNNVVILGGSIQYSF